LTLLGASGGRIQYRAIGEAQAGAAGAVPEAVAMRWDGWESLNTTPAQADKADVILGLAPAARGRYGVALLEGLTAHAAPGAVLLLAEPAPGALWGFTLGQDAAWWRDDPEGALPDAAAWRAALGVAAWQCAEVQALQSAPWPALLISGQNPSVKPTEVARDGAGPSVIFTDAETMPLAEALAARQGPGQRPAIWHLGEIPPPKALRGADILALTGMADPARALAAMTALAAAADGVARSLMMVAEAEEARAAALIGLGRVLTNEMPGLKPRRRSALPRAGVSRRS
jgi:hypothetical protein